MNFKVWIILLFLTCLTFVIGYFNYVNAAFVAIILVTVMIKVQLIIDYFMELKNVTYGYRFIPTLWLLVVITLIAIAYYF
ncbi:MAG TPA: hypothetical protein EYG70_04105 [Sulfurimonas sp.]|nr:hypothetical protein [Sulfurimonas sp.]